MEEIKFKPHKGYSTKLLKFLPGDRIEFNGKTYTYIPGPDNLAQMPFDRSLSEQGLYNPNKTDLVPVKSLTITNKTFKEIKALAGDNLIEKKKLGAFNRIVTAYMLKV